MALKLYLFVATFLLSVNISIAQLVTSELDDMSEGTLRKEIMDAKEGDTITFDPSVKNIKLDSEIFIEKDLVIHQLLDEFFTMQNSIDRGRHLITYQF